MNNGHLSCNFHKEYAIVLPVSPDINDHTDLFAISHLNGSNFSNHEDKIHSHLVAVINSFLNHNNHLVGTINSKIVVQFSVCILTISHLRVHIFSIITHPNSSGTDITAFSIGSYLIQSFSSKITSGALTCNSNHSLLIVSISTERCNSHLPDTKYELSHLSS